MILNALTLFLASKFVILYDFQSFFFLLHLNIWNDLSFFIFEQLSELEEELESTQQNYTRQTSSAPGIIYLFGSYLCLQNICVFPILPFRQIDHQHIFLVCFNVILSINFQAEILRSSNQSSTKFCCHNINRYETKSKTFLIQESISTECQNRVSIWCPIQCTCSENAYVTKLKPLSTLSKGSKLPFLPFVLYMRTLDNASVQWATHLKAISCFHAGSWRYMSKCQMAARHPSQQLNGFLWTWNSV